MVLLVKQEDNILRMLPKPRSTVAKGSSLTEDSTTEDVYIDHKHIN